jgi:sulfonate transport system substrate-binding protein
MKRQIGIAAAVACLLLVQASVASADAVRLRIGWAQVPSQITPLVAELSKTHPEFFPGLGKSYTYEPIRFQGSTPQIQALASGELEVGAFGPSALALAVLNARLDMRMIADVMQDGGEDYYSTWWAVKKDGPIKSFTDLKGRTAVVNAKGVTTDMHLRGMMRRHGVADGDYAIIEADFANMLAMVENGKADAVPVMPQFSHDFEATGRYRSLFTTREAVGGSDQVGFWAAKAEFIAQHRPALVDFLADHMRATRWFVDAKNRAEVLALTQAFTKQSKDSLAYVFTKGDIYRSPDLVPNVTAVQKDIDEAAEMKLLPGRIEVAPKYLDLSMAEEAKARLDKK